MAAGEADRQAVIGLDPSVPNTSRRGQRRAEQPPAPGPAALPTRMERSRDRPAEQRVGPAVWATAAVLVLFLALPLVALIWRGIEAGRGISGETFETLRQALTLSFLTSAASLLVVVAFGTPLAYLLARKAFAGRRLIETLVDLPIVLPPAVAGIALLVAFGRRGIVGEFLTELGITIGFTTTAVILAQIFVAVPFFVRAARSGFVRVDRDLEVAAASLGASPGVIFWRITFPLARPGLLAGAVLAWARAMGEFGATIMFAGNYPGVSQTMPLAIYGRFGAGDLGSALLLSLVLLASSLLVLIGVRALDSRQDPLS